MKKIKSLLFGVIFSLMLLQPYDVKAEKHSFTASILPCIKLMDSVANVSKLAVVLEPHIGWTSSNVNIRLYPDTDSDILGTYIFNSEVEYTNYNELWVKVKYQGQDGYIYKKYISDKQTSYTDYTVPSTTGFKSYMSYKCITAVSSPQYKLQVSEAYTGKYGIRQVNGRYCVAIGSHFTSKIGTWFDLILENGTVIPCILADQKADKDTDGSNIVTQHNGCMSEFVVDDESLVSSAKQQGNVSYCNTEWNSPVAYVRVYEKEE